jgi:pyrroline-5-carboxylate reductase
MAQSPAFAFIGCGNMGMAVLRGALSSGALRSHSTLVVEASPERRQQAADLGVKVSDAVRSAAAVPRMVLAVKPQSFEVVAAELQRSPDSTPPLVISIMAGWSAQSIQNALSGARVVRTMPNLPAQIGLGMTGVAPAADVSVEEATFVERLFAGVGRTVRVREDQLNAVTAVSGSGPAYLFLLAEAEIAAGVKLGLDENSARAMVMQTLLGAATMLAAGPHSAEQLRAAVTSKGGTTQAALDVFARRGFTDAVEEAMNAASERGRALGR